MKKLKFVISAVIIFALISGMIPTIFAINQAENDFIPSKIVREIIEKREESSKTFLCEDGTYLAVTYSEPIHYKDAGVWKEVDNSLILDAKKNYSPRSSGYSIYLPESMSADKKIIAQNGDSTLSFSIDLGANLNSSMNKAKRVPVENLASNAIYKNDEKNDINYNENEKTTEVEEYNNKLTEVKNQKNALVYNDLFPGVDFEYVVSSGSLKENIVINQPQDKYMYSFSVDFSGLTPVTNPDGSISLMRDKEAVFVLSAPYMYDMNRAESVDVKMFLKENNDNYILTISADCEWINSKERAFPVIIDPTINIATNEISDVFVENLMFANSPRSNDELRVGKNLTNLTRTYIKTTLPTTIPYGSVINSANLTLYKDYYFQAWNQSDINVVACDCSSRSTWQADSVSWNNQPFSNAVNGYQNVSGCQIASVAVTESKTTYIFNVKTAAQKWLNTGTNKGIMLASSNENSKTQIDFHSTRVNDSTQRPKMSISYTSRGVSPTTWSPSYNASNTTISVVCNPSWTITSNQNWLSYTNKTSNSFKAKVTQNTGTQTRTGTLQVTSGSTIIGTVTVTQTGTAPVLNTSVNEVVLRYNETEPIIVSYNSNLDFSISTSSNWLVVENNENEEQIEISAVENNTNETREDIIVLQSGNNRATISVKQLDKISSYFVKRNGNNIIEKTSNDYNHPLATWCMNLSNYSYNPLTGPSNIYLAGFVNSSRTVFEEMSSYDFNTQDYNIGRCEMFRHTISHRSIITANGQERDLVVVVVRGTETIPEIISDMCSEFSPNGEYSFGRGSRIVLTSLLGENYNNESSGNYEPCTLCNGTGCDFCEGYLSHYSLNNPIIVVTGHSLGAAVSNIVVHELNQFRNSESGIYGYTFGTPYINSTTGNIPSGDFNLYNILNNNDVVTFVPMSISAGSYVQGTWYRYGNDLRITMPYFSEIFENLDSSYLGIGGHIMRIYENWMESLPGKINIDAQNITDEIIQQQTTSNTQIGVLPRIASKVLKIFCPVDVTLYDEDGHIIAYEGRNNTSTNNSPVEIASWSTNNGEKYFVIPYGYETTTVFIEAYDYGSMTYSVESVGLDASLAEITFNDVNLYPGKEFTTEVSPEIDIEDTSLYIVENGVVVGEVTETNPHFISITTDLNDIEYPTPIHLTITTDTTVSEINLYNRTRNTTMHLVPNGIYVQSVVNTGDTLVWTIGYYPQWGNNVYDISVKSGDDWYDYENVIEIRCTHN